MTKLRDTVDKELSAIKCKTSAEQIFEEVKSTPKAKFSFPKVAAAVVVLVLLSGVFFMPFGDSSDSGFVIVANAETVTDADGDQTLAGDEITDEVFMTLKDEVSNYIFYNFSYVLDPDAEDTDLVRKYLFHSFNKRLDIKVEGKDIESIAYKINNGALISGTFSKTDDGGSVIYMQEAKSHSEITVDYDKQESTWFCLNPVASTTDFYNNAERYYALKDTGEIVTVDKTATAVYNTNTGELLSFEGLDTIGSGYMSEDTLATEEEIAKLREYLDGDDMVGFYNYQNKIFERILNSITLDITVAKTSGETESKTLEFCYTPDLITEISADTVNQDVTFSSGTLSAKIKR